GLPCEGVYDLQFDDHHTLWIYATCGVASVASAELERWLAHPESRIDARLLDAVDGAQPSQPTFQPGSGRSTDGRLWFTNDRVVQMIDPAQVAHGGAPPPTVHVERVVADRRDYDPQAALRLPALTRDLEIAYTAPTSVAPQKLQFRYRLDGYDREWQDAG